MLKLNKFGGLYFTNDDAVTKYLSSYGTDDGPGVASKVCIYTQDLLKNQRYCFRFSRFLFVIPSYQSVSIFSSMDKILDSDVLVRGILVYSYNVRCGCWILRGRLTSSRSSIHDRFWKEDCCELFN